MTNPPQQLDTVRDPMRLLPDHPAAAMPPKFVEVDAEKHQIWPNWREIWEFRLVLVHLVIRDYKVRFRQTLIGVAWAVIQPVTTMIVFTIFFNGVAGITTPNGVPYPLFSFAALVPWTFFSNGLSLASESLVGQGHLVRKVYVPRLLIPISRILGGAIDYAISIGVLLLLMLIYHQPLPLQAWLMVPLLSIFAMLITTGISLWTSAMMVYYRDVRYLIPFAVQILLFVSPIAYSSQRLGEGERMLYALNPMVSVIEGMRAALLNIDSLPPTAYLISALVTLVIVVTGIAFFRRAEGRFADMI
ncbi:MAG: ABC transporter permease [Anaerolineae bacterium]|nr:ABC transporter permease [Anaerolineae bacterium]